MSVPKDQHLKLSSDNSHALFHIKGSALNPPIMQLLGSQILPVYNHLSRLQSVEENYCSMRASQF